MAPENQDPNPNGATTQAANGARSIPPQPEKPNPSSDPGVVPPIVPPSFSQVGDLPTTSDFDVEAIEPLLALKILARGIDSLCNITGDMPPTPPVSRPLTPAVQDLRNDHKPGHRRTQSRPATPPTPVPNHDIQHLKAQIGSPEAGACEPTVTPDLSKRTQQDAIARRFFSKRPPPVSIDDYLLRLHRYCPMSVAVYLAAAVYIHKLGVEDKVVPVTSRTVHRLLLAALRVAMKALEDLSYPHKRFAGVGGVSEKELAKLEVSLCYLLDFGLRVTNEMLQSRSWALLQMTQLGSKSQAQFMLSLPMRSRRGTVA